VTCGNILIDHPPHNLSDTPFLDWTDAHLTAAASFRGDLSYPAQCAVVHQAGRVVTVLGRYFADLPPPDTLDLARGADAAAQGPPAARILGPAADAAAESAHPVAAHLAAAADYLTVGRDLLETHFADGPGGLQTPRSWWAPVITSEPVTAAVLAELAGHSQNLASCVAALAVTQRVRSATPTAALLTLRQAAPWLQLAAHSIQDPQHELPIARSLLRAIPASTPPPRPPPDTDEPVPVLCDRIPVTAERLRHAAFAAGARWSPVPASLSWRRDALGCAIISHASDLILRALADRASQLGLHPLLATQLRAAAGQMTPAWTAWRAVAGHWDILTTGTYRGAGLTPVAADIGDLALRAGRLVYRNPNWTPARADASPLRDPADLAPTPADLLTVLAAVHHAADAASRIATSDQHAATTAAAQTRLYIPVRLLPDKYDIPHPYAFAPRKYTDALLAAYHTAAHAAAPSPQPSTTWPSLSTPPAACSPQPARPTPPPGTGHPARPNISP
jgi:hypothetical protein